MPRREIVWALLVAGLTLGGVAAAQAPSKTGSPETDLELRFLRGLRDRGYYDLALDYIDQMLQAKDTPAALKPVLNYEIGRGKLDEATQLGDLERRTALLEQARVKLDEFAKSYPNHALAPEALVQLARLNVERGHTAMLQANEVKTVTEDGKPSAQGQAERETKLVAARAAFDEARKAYAKAEVRLKANFDAFPKFIPEGDPRKEARERAHTALMDDQLQRAVVDYEEAQTYPLGSKERNALLDRGIAAFEELYKNYRTQMSGLHAQMLEGKCYEEKGDLGAAMGLYDQLMDHADPRLRDLQRQVGFYRIIVIGKRKEHALAVDEAVRWLNANPNNRVSEEGLGVQLELAKNILAQLPTMQSDAERDEAVRKAVDRLTEVVRYYSPYKPEALELLQKYKPRAARNVNQIANLTYDDAMAQADTAISTHDWGLAVALLSQAIRKAEAARDIDKVNRARYFLSYVYYASERYYESDVVAEHLARSYPQGGLSAKAAEIGMASLTMAYNTFSAIDRASDLDRLVDLATYTAETWPDSDQADAARVTLGEIAMGRGQYLDAARWLEAVRENSPRRLDALVKAGDARWREAQALREENKTAEADSEAKTALDLIAGALKARDDAHVAVADPGRITNANALAEIHRSSGRPAEAIKLLEPIVQALSSTNPSAEVVPLYSATLSILLRSHLANGQPDQAIQDMKTLEAVSPSKAALTQLYFELGRSLKNEMDQLEAKNDRTALEKTKDAYRQFLQALVGSQAGQTYDSLQWAGESMLSLKMPEEAGKVFQRVLDTYSKDPQFQKLADAKARLLRTKLKLVASLRDQGEFNQARDMLQPILDENPRLIDPLMEKGYLLEAQAQAENSRARWEVSRDYWKNLALRLRGGRPLRPEYYEAWYHVGVAMFGLGDKKQAISTLKGVMTLTPSVGGPEMKAKYQALLARMGS